MDIRLGWEKKAPGREDGERRGSLRMGEGEKQGEKDDGREAGGGLGDPDSALTKDGWCRRGSSYLPQQAPKQGAAPGQRHTDDTSLFIFFPSCLHPTEGLTKPLTLPGTRKLVGQGLLT